MMALTIPLVLEPKRCLMTNILKLYKLETNLIDHNKNTLENSLDFTKEKDDLYIGFNASIL